MGSCPSCGAAVTDSEFQCRNCSGDSDADRLFAINAEIERLKSDIEILMAELDHQIQATVGPCVLSNICEAGRNEIEYRVERLDKVRQSTNTWKQYEKETDRDDQH